MADQTTYLFIDGKYLRDIYAAAMMDVFQTSEELLPNEIARLAVATKAFFYDCPDEKKAEESEDSFTARKDAQEKYFAEIRSLKGFHVQLGTLRGGRRREQKEVDVLLAVDMLTHGFYRNMTRAVLLAGDLDFRPVVEALVRGGTFVEIWYEGKSASKDLYWAADYGRALEWWDFYNWSSDSFKRDHLLPTVATRLVVPEPQVLETGSFEGNPAWMMKNQGNNTFLLRTTFGGQLRSLEHDDWGVLTRYFATVYGNIQWHRP